MFVYVPMWEGRREKETKVKKKTTEEKRGREKEREGKEITYFKHSS